MSVVSFRYNPILWGVPKGSYASDPNGPCRLIEFRKMVQVDNFVCVSDKSRSVYIQQSVTSSAQFIILKY